MSDVKSQLTAAGVWSYIVGGGAPDVSGYSIIIKRNGEWLYYHYSRGDFDFTQFIAGDHIWMYLYGTASKILTFPTGATRSLTPGWNNDITWYDIAQQTLVANFSKIPIIANVGETIHFYDQSVGNPSSWSWNFGDGGISSSKDPTHTYGSAGTYTVTLTVSNSTQSSTTSVTMPIIGVITPVPNFSLSPISPKVSDTVMFSDLSTNAVQFAWFFGDHGKVGGQGMSTLQNPTYQYTYDGVFTVTHVVYSSAGQSASITKTVTVTPNVLDKGPTAKFTADKVTADVGEDVTFTDASTPSEQTQSAISSRNWNFGDNQIDYGNKTSIVHAYTEPGVKTAQLTVLDLNGRQDGETLQITINETVIGISIGEVTVKQI